MLSVRADYVLSSLQIPIDFQLAPLPKRPARHASADQHSLYQGQLAAANINFVALARLKTLRHELDAEQDPGRPRNLQLVVDGRFTNAKLLKNLPHHTTLIGRIRRDAKLFLLPQTQSATGRKRVYGQQAPTPQELLADPCIEFQTLQAQLSDRSCHFRVKSLGPLRAMQAGGGHQLQLLVIAPLGYRLRKGSKLLYRQPAFLICTDPSLSIDSLLQSYLWRWDIEVNFRDQKSLLGVGEAQVRNPYSVQCQPAVAVAAYGLLLLAAVQCHLQALGSTQMAFRSSAQTPLDRFSNQPAAPRTVERFDPTTKFYPLQLQHRPRPQPPKTPTRTSFCCVLCRRLAPNRAKPQTQAKAWAARRAAEP